MGPSEASKVARCAAADWNAPDDWKRKVVEAITPEENARRVMVEATRLASLAPGEWRLWIDRSAERLRIPRATLQGLIAAIIKDSEKKARDAETAARRQELAVRREQERKQGEDGSIVVGKISDNETYTYGYDAQEGQYGDLVSKGIIDPTKVVRTALQDAASIAGLLMTTEAMVAEKPKKETPAMPGMPPGGMDY